MNDILVTVCVCKQGVTTGEYYKQKVDPEKSRDCMLIAFILAGKELELINYIWSLRMAV